MLAKVFVYGTLRSEYLMRKLGCRVIDSTSGTIPGEMYNAGDYPIVIYDPNSSFVIAGDVVTIADAPIGLLILDHYEGIIGDKSFLYYKRVLLPVSVGGKIERAWVYVCRDELKKTVRRSLTQIVGENNIADWMKFRQSTVRIGRVK